jgi:hypothetical protein
MVAELSEQETTTSLRDGNRLSGRLNNLLSFPARTAKLGDAMPEDEADGAESDFDDSADDPLDRPADNIGRHVAEVVAGMSAAMAAFATLLDVEGILPKEKVHAALSSAWLDMSEAEALGGAGDVFEDVLARLS